MCSYCVVKRKRLSDLKYFIYFIFCIVSTLSLCVHNSDRSYEMLNIVELTETFQLFQSCIFFIDEFSYSLCMSFHLQI